MTIVKKMLLAGSLALSGPILADPISSDTLCTRFELTMTVFRYDSTGKILHGTVGEERRYRVGSLPKADGPIVCEVKGGVGSQSKALQGPLILRHEWQVRRDGTIVGVVKQFKRMQGDEYRDQVDEGEFVISDMAPILWKSRTHTSDRVIVRFTPSLGQEEAPADLDKIAISGVDVSVADSRGHQWADHLNFSGAYFGLSTHRGSLFLSYYPFPGSSRIGVARARSIEVDLGEDGRVSLRGADAFLPGRVQAHVYGVIDLGRKTSGIGSVHSWTSSDPNEFLEIIRR